jgi:hypothetical protein
MNQDNFNSPNEPHDFDQTEFDEFDGLNTAGDQNFHDDFDAAPKKKSNMTTIILVLIILGAAGAAGYFFYFKPLLEAQTQDSATAIPPVTSQNGLPAGVTEPSDAPMPAPSEAPMPDAPADANAVAPIDNAPTSLVPATPETDAPASENGLDNSALPAPTVAATPADSSADAADVDAVEAPSRLPSPADAAATNDDATIKPVLPTSTTETAPAPVDALTPVDSNVASTAPAMPTPAASTAPVAPAMAATTPSADPALAQKVADLDNKVANLPSAEQIAKLTSKLDSLTQRLDALDKRTETLAGAIQDMPASAPAAKSSVAPIATLDSDEPAPAPVAKKPVAAKPKAKPASQPKAAAAKWVLRSAQPGVAWVSKAGNEEMVRYTVGQTLPGSGTITAIEQDATGWVLKTNQGASIRP